MADQPQILQLEGKPVFAVLPIEHYLAMRRRLEDQEDLAALLESEQADAHTTGQPLNDVLRELGLDQASASDQPCP